MTNGPSNVEAELRKKLQEAEQYRRFLIRLICTIIATNPDARLTQAPCEKELAPIFGPSKSYAGLEHILRNMRAAAEMLRRMADRGEPSDNMNLEDAFAVAYQLRRLRGLGYRGEAPNLVWAVRDSYVEYHANKHNPPPTAAASSAAASAQPPPPPPPPSVPAAVTTAATSPPKKTTTRKRKAQTEPAAAPAAAPKKARKARRVGRTAAPPAPTPTSPSPPVLPKIVLVTHTPPAPAAAAPPPPPPPAPRRIIINTRRIRSAERALALQNYDDIDDELYDADD